MEMDSRKSNSLRKRMRRTHTRKVQQDCVINMAEARREIAHALLLHRSSSSSSCVFSMAEARREIAHALLLHRSSSSSTTTTSTSSSFVKERQPTSNMLGNSCNYGIINPNVVSSQYCYSLMESMPLPEPIWSTTAPSTHVVPQPPPPMEALEFEWGENQASSYTWWLGFLETLDANNIEKLNKYPYVENIGMGNSRVFGQRQDGSILKEPPLLNTTDQNSSPDEWLMVPTTEHPSEQP